MAPSPAVPPPPPGTGVGRLLRYWRTVRHHSQLDLALACDVSSRHLSCLETGKSQPSREMVLRLADSLQIPLRERNTLLVAAGYAPSYFEADLGAPVLAQMRNAIDLILNHQEPYPAIVMDRHWNVVLGNQAAARFLPVLLGYEPTDTNVIRMSLHPDGLRQVTVNWEETAEDLIRHLHHQIAALPSDEKAKALLEEVLAYPGVPERWRGQEMAAPATPLLTTVLRKDEMELRFFSTITTFATPHNVTLDELRIECNFPADEATALACRRLFGS